MWRRSRDLEYFNLLMFETPCPAFSHSLNLIEIVGSFWFKFSFSWLIDFISVWLLLFVTEGVHMEEQFGGRGWERKEKKERHHM